MEFGVGWCLNFHLALRLLFSESSLASKHLANTNFLIVLLPLLPWYRTASGVIQINILLFSEVLFNRYSECAMSPVPRAQSEKNRHNLPYGGDSFRTKCHSKNQNQKDTHESAWDQLEGKEHDLRTSLPKSSESDWIVREGFVEEVIFEPKSGVREFNMGKGNMRDGTAKPKGKLWH